MFTYGNNVFLADCIADIVLVVDSSGSINDAHPTNWNLVRDTLASLVDNFNVSPNGNHVALVTFSTKAQFRFGLEQFTDVVSLEEVIAQLPYQGGKTNTPEGLRRAREDALATDNGNRDDVKDVVILLTDGTTSSSYESFLDEQVEALKDTGAEIFGEITVNVFVAWRC